MFHPFGINDNRSSTGVGLGKICSYCGVYFIGQHTCSDFSQPKISYVSDHSKIIQRLDKIIELLEKLTK